MKFWHQPSRPYEFTSPVVDHIKSKVLSIKPLSTFIFANSIWRKRFTRREVNERILETPFILGRIPTNPVRILDVGACESPLSLMLASMGNDVTALDLREYAFPHPNLKSVVSDITKHNQTKKFDVIICLSTLEHIGLEVYGSKQISKGDKLAVKNMFNLLKPGGKLLLTTPLANVDKTHELWREYSIETLSKMMEDFSKVTILIGAKNSNQQWNITDKIDTNGTQTPIGVALIEAIK